MNLGVLLLLGAGILDPAGFGQQVLDRLYLNDKQALLFLAAMVVGALLISPSTAEPRRSPLTSAGPFSQWAWRFMSFPGPGAGKR